MISKTLIDTARSVDLLALAEKYTSLKHVASTEGGEYAGPCPTCGGRDRFRVQPLAHRWLCRHCTQGKWQDAIALYRAVYNATFAEAVTALAGDDLPPAPAQPLEPSPRESSGPPGSPWQQKARALIAEAETALWHADHARALYWLNGRGLSDETLKRWHIGFIPKARWECAADWGLSGKSVFVERGILIPAIVNGTIWYLKIRRAAGAPKYIQLRGSLPALFMADTLPPAREACVTEGEFDALLLWQCLQQASNLRWQRLGVTTLGSETNRLDLAHWARYLYHLRLLLILYDQDGKSDKGIAYWQQIAGRAFAMKWRNIREGDKDLTDYHQSGGRLLDLASWGVMQAEQPANLPALPGYVTEFIDDVGLTVTNYYHSGDMWRATVSKPNRNSNSQGLNTQI